MFKPPVGPRARIHHAEMDRRGKDKQEEELALRLDLGNSQGLTLGVLVWPRFWAGLEKLGRAYDAA